MLTTVVNTTLADRVSVDAGTSRSPPIPRLARSEGPEGLRYKFFGDEFGP